MPPSYLINYMVEVFQHHLDLLLFLVSSRAMGAFSFPYIWAVRGCEPGLWLCHLQCIALIPGLNLASVHILSAQGQM